MFLRRSLASLARAYRLQFFLLSVHLGGFPPPPPPIPKSWLRYWVGLHAPLTIYMYRICYIITQELTYTIAQKLYWYETVFCCIVGKEKETRYQLLLNFTEKCPINNTNKILISDYYWFFRVISTTGKTIIHDLALGNSRTMQQTDKKRGSKQCPVL